jgi:hypothetical protein
MNLAQLQSFGKRYTAAWCSLNAASVAAFFSEAGSLQINGGAPSLGRTAITASAQGFMTAFPDMMVTMDGVDRQGDGAVYRWTLTGTNTGPGGSGEVVRISGYEEWRFGADGLIAESRDTLTKPTTSASWRVALRGRDDAAQPRAWRRRHRDRSSRWKEVVEPIPGRFMHHLELFAPSDVDSAVKNWFRSAWSAAARRARASAGRSPGVRPLRSSPPLACTRPRLGAILSRRR